MEYTNESELERYNQEWVLNDLKLVRPGYWIDDSEPFKIAAAHRFCMYLSQDAAKAASENKKLAHAVNISTKANRVI